MKVPREIAPGLAGRLRAAREAAGLSLAQLASRSCTPAGLLAAAEREEEPLGALSLRLVCEALRCSADWLLGLEPQMVDPWPDLKPGVRVRSLGLRWRGEILSTSRTTYTWCKVRWDDGTVHRIVARHLEVDPAASRREAAKKPPR